MAGVRSHSEFNKRLGNFLTNGTAPCPDCGMDMPAGDHDLRMAHYAVCGGKRVDGDALTSVESDELAAREQVIERGFKVWQEVGEALLHIRDKRLYRAKYATFEDYCRERWNMQRRHAYRLIDASEVYNNVSHGTQNVPDFGDDYEAEEAYYRSRLPQNERQARPLAELAPEEQQLVWQVVQNTAPAGKVTAAHVKSVVNVLKEVTVTGALDDGTGEQIPVAAATPEHLKAAVTEETYERLKRQEAYIEEKQAAKKRGVPPALQSSESEEWYTPAKYIDAVRALMGGIDVDPASNPEANQIVQAAQFYTLADDGLQHDWQGRVFLNPPYGRDEISNQERWSVRLMEQYEAGITTEAVLLVNAVTDRQWFQPLWRYPICFTDHRIRFYRPGADANSPVIGSVFVYFGRQTARFAELFKAFGPVVLQVLRGSHDSQ